MREASEPTRATFICQGLNPFTRQPFDLFDWWVLEPFMRYRRVSLSLATTRKAQTTRLGGSPEFVDEWPQGAAGPLPFIAQLDLAELAQQAGAHWPRAFPRSGVISLFFDEREADGSQFSLIFDAGERRRPPRGALPQIGRSAALHVSQKKNASRHQLGGSPVWVQAAHAASGHYRSGAYRNYPSVLAALAAAGVAEDALCNGNEEAVAAARLLDAAGIPPERLAGGLRECCLLFQIDAVPELGLRFGSGGRLYVFGDPTTLRIGRSALAWAEMQYS